MSILSERRTRLLVATPSRALRYLPGTALALDSGAVLGTAVLASLGRERLPFFGPGVSVSENVGSVAPLIVVGWILTIAALGGYSVGVFGAGTDEFKRVLNASLLAAGLIGVACYLAKFSLSRGFFFLLFAIGIPGLILGRALLRRAVHEARRHGNLRHTVVIAGSPSYVDEIAAVLRRESWLGYHVIGALTPPHHLDAETQSGIPVLGNADDATAVVRAAGADVVFFAGGALGSMGEMRRIAWDLEHDDVQVVVAPSVADVSSERVRIRPVGGLPLIHIDPPRSIHASRWGKRTFDVIGSAGLLVVFSPLFALAALQIWLFDRGPVLFRQTRVGKNGAEFSCLKFRTMVTDAEDRLSELHAKQGHDGGLFKMKDDPRVTRPGKWLRRLSLDELPQLVNVFRGEMSLVGPRPPLPREVAQYEGDTGRRLRVLPGLTGLWQVSGRSDLSWSEAIRLDLYYVDNWSMLQDLSILTKTLAAVFSSRGAY
ncbi:sugar transferase [Nocardioides sp.]|jgi:exopolysaccharide biosynthesis polyprenyl glycosylphosphotransferase|uniref:sugar transferase n=1 Tax=Nocardioides sp. TaxID=35761 RepID=UPI0031FE596C|nr:Undecaprenyl-phosphate galactose phosphotransferase, WbaP/exopolysaccharide biosynthesis polyprenyl [Nocardioides sp.]